MALVISRPSIVSVSSHSCMSIGSNYSESKNSSCLMFPSCYIPSARLLNVIGILSVHFAGQLSFSKRVVLAERYLQWLKSSSFCSEGRIYRAKRGIKAEEITFQNISNQIVFFLNFRIFCFYSEIHLLQNKSCMDQRAIYSTTVKKTRVFNFKTYCFCVVKSCCLVQQIRFVVLVVWHCVQDCVAFRAGLCGNVGGSLTIPLFPEPLSDLTCSAHVSSLQNSRCLARPELCCA